MFWFQILLYLDVLAYSRTICLRDLSTGLIIVLYIMLLTEATFYYNIIFDQGSDLFMAGL